MTFMQMTENYMLSPTSDHRYLTTPVISHGGETSGRGGWISNDHCWGKLLIRSDHWQISYASLETSESRISKSGFIKSAIKNKLRIRRSSWIIATKTLNSLHKCSKGILTSPMQLICYYFPIQYSLDVKRPLSYNGT